MNELLTWEDEDKIKDQRSRRNEAPETNFNRN